MNGETEAPARRAFPGSALAGALCLFAFYLASAYPTLSCYRDSGDMAASALTLGIAHPPGYPLFTLSAKAWLAVFRLGNVAYRLHVFSALLGAGACLTLFLALFCAERPRRSAAPWAGGLCAALLLAFAPAFRHLSVVSEMYSLHALLAASIAACALVPALRSPKGLCAAALLLGLGAGVHQTILAAAPLILLSGWSLLSPFQPREGGAARRPALWAALALLLLLGLLAYAYLPLRSITDPALNWGEPRSLRNFLRMLTRADYGGVRLHPGRPAGVGSLAGWRDGLALSARVFAKELGFSGLLLLLLGCVRVRRSAAAAGCLSGFLLAGPVFMVWANLDPVAPESYAILEPHLVLPLVFAAVLAGLGAQSLVRRAPRKAAAGLLALAAAWPFPRSGTPLMHRGDFSAWDFGSGLLDSLPKGSLLVDPDDPTAFTLSYMALAHGLRPDVVPFLYFRTRWGYEQFRRRHPDLLPGREIRSGPELLAAAVSKALDEGRPVFVDLPQKIPQGTFGFPAGLAYRILRAPPTAEQARAMLASSLQQAEFIRGRPLSDKTDFFTRHTLAYWPSSLNNLGVEAQRLGLDAEAGRVYRLALRAGPWLSESWNNWGNAAVSLGDPAAAIGCYEASLRERYAPQVVYNLGRACLLAGRFEAAEEQFKKVIAAANLIDAHNDLGLLYLRTGRVEEAVREWMEVLQRDPRYAAAYYNLALAFQRLGRKQDAVRALAQYQALAGSPAERREARSWMQRLQK